MSTHKKVESSDIKKHEMVNPRHQVVCLSTTAKFYELSSEYMNPRLAVEAYLSNIDCRMQAKCLKQFTPCYFLRKKASNRLFLQKSRILMSIYPISKYLASGA